MVRAMRAFRSVVVFPIFGLALLLPKLQILWWSLGRGIALDDLHHDHGDPFGDACGDAFDDYARLG
jgi:hypothetical protein